MILSLLAFAAPAQSQTAGMNISYSSESPGALPVWVAKETGLYAKNGLNVELVRVTGNVAVMALISGDLNIGFIGGSAAITSNLGGSDAIMVASGQVATDYSLLAHSSIKSVDQLRGKSVGVASQVGSAMTATLHALQKHGLTRNDVSLLVVGGTPERLAALRTGRIHATLLSPPTSFAAEREGFNILAEANIPLPYNSVVSTRRFIKQNPDVARRFIKAHLEAVHLLKTNRETGVKTLAKYLRQTKDRQLVEKSYDISTSDQILPRKQYPTVPGIKTVLEGLVKTHPRAATARPEEFFDVGFIKEFDESGFIDALYKK
jgi:ABC-type nitrate/sulfonate/bicarbonate transport system substrate-binding protein